MPSLNQVILLGHLGRDPELRMSKNGKAFCTFSMATSENRKVGGEWQSDTTWHYVTVFGDAAERVAGNSQKGDLMLVQGRISRRKYQDKDGNEKESVEIMANRCNPIVPKGERRPAAKPTPQAPMDFEDDLPF